MDWTPEKEALLGLLLHEAGYYFEKSAVIPSRNGQLPQLSFAQQRLWFLDQLVPQNPAYNIPVALQLSGRLDTAVLQQSLQRIINRHDSLRTAFTRHNGRPVPVIAHNLQLDLPIIDVGYLADDEIQNEIDEQVQRPFSLTHPPLIRPTLLRRSPTDHILVLPLHHIIGDGWSVDNLLHELGSLMMGKPLPALPIQYGDFALWERGEVQKTARQTQLAYWQQQLGGDRPVLQLPLDYPRPSVQTFNGATYSMEIEWEQRSRSAGAHYPTTQLLSQENATPFMLLLAVFNTLLYRYTGQTEVMVGTPVANRPRPELHDLIGFFVNTVALRTDLSGEPTFRQLLRRVRQIALDGFANQDVPFEMIVEALNPERDLSHQPLFQVMFALQEPVNRWQWGDLQVQRWQADTETAKFDLNLTVALDETNLIAHWQYNTDLFAPDTIERMARHYRHLLTAVLTAPDIPISQLVYLDEAEQKQILLGWNEPITHEQWHMCLHRLFEIRAEQMPRATAVRFEEQTLTYAELNGRANQLAHHLQKLGVAPEKLVGIYMSRSIEWLIAMLAVLKAGAAYVPLDPRFPPERIGFMLADAQAEIVLVRQQLPLQPCPPNVQMVAVDGAYFDDEPLSNPDSGVQPENLVYVLFTSGSTGRSKGVAVEHRQLWHYVTAVTHRLQLPHHAHYATVSTFAADLGHTVLFPSLILGGCLHIISEDRLSDPNALADYLSRHPIDCLKIVPSHLSALLTVLQPQRLLPRQRLILGGEASSWQLMARLHQLAAPTCRIFNHYGPTETTVGVCTFEIGRVGEWEIGEARRGDGIGAQGSKGNVPPISHALQAATVPIGRPLPRTQLYILDPHMNPVPVGVTGELYIGGAGVTRGYLHRPELTEERFVPLSVPGNQLLVNHNPITANGLPMTVYRTGDLARHLPDGSIEFLGRIDHQVKIRGFRVELGEIEAMLREVETVQEALVMAVNGRLITYIVGQTSEDELRSHLNAQLPNYMIPSAFVFLDQLPLTANGKIDRRALPQPDRHDPNRDFAAPTTATEQTLATIWADLLSLEQIGLHDDFFALGGHSLLATQLISRIQRAFGLTIPVRRLFEAPTLVELAIVIDKRERNVSDTLLNLPDEVVLDPDIQPVPGEITSEPRAVFLTGATGFLGAFLLAELLKRDTVNADRGAVIYCLIRGDGRRIEQNLCFYGLWREEWHERIVPIVGDLALPLLGLTADQFHHLAQTIDIIYHNGAWVNFIYPYSILKPANVGSTQEILRLASQGKTKAVHYVSTLSVFPPSEATRMEADSLDDWQGLAGSYAQSKWVAERILKLAQRRGFAVSVYRPGRITGHGETAVFNHDDFLYKLIKGCLQLGLAPDLDMQVDMTPVDYVSRAIVQLSSQPQAIGQAYHLLNAQPISWRDLLGWLQDFGYELEVIPYETWHLALLSTTPANALHPFLPIFSEDTFTLDEDTHFDAKNVLNSLAATEITCPPVDDVLLTTYFSHFVETGFLDRPPTSGKVQVVTF